MKTIISLIVLSIFMFGCSTEENLYTIKKKIRNSSEYPFELTIIDYSNDTVFHQFLQPQSFSNEFSQTTNINYIMGWGDVASKIKIRFLNNNRGYECNVEHTGDKCLSSKGSPFNSNNPQDYTVEENLYIYEITQEDYENAHVLP